MSIRPLGSGNDTPTSESPQVDPTTSAKAPTADTLPTANVPPPAIEGTDSVTPVVNEIYKAVTEHQQRQRRRSECRDERSLTIHVDGVVSKLAHLYEKLRNTLDYQDDHLRFKNAIERILARLIAAANTQPQVAKQQAAQTLPDAPDVARTLVVELIRAGYLANGRFPEAKLTEIGAIIERYVTLESEIAKEPANAACDLNSLRKWIINLAATNLSENIENDDRDVLAARPIFGTKTWSADTGSVITAHLHRLLDSNVYDPADDDAFTREKEIQIYVSIYRKLFNYSQAMLEFVLLRRLTSSGSELSDDAWHDIAKNYSSLRSEIDRHVHHPFGRQLQPVATRYATCFSILKDSFEDDPPLNVKRINREPPKFEKWIHEICERRYADCQKQLFVNALKCMTYVFLTKMVLVLLLEAPLTNLLTPDMPANVKLFSLGVNIIFPPLLLLLMAVFTAVPGTANSRHIFNGIAEIVYGRKSDDQLVKLSYPKEDKNIDVLFFGVFAILSITSLSIVGLCLYHIGCTWVSIAIFIVFITIINFLGVNLQKIAREYQVATPKATVFSFIADQFYIPVIAVGRQISKVFSDNNVVVLLLDKVVEGPYKRLVNLAERWSEYLRTKREESLD